MAELIMGKYPHSTGELQIEIIFLLPIYLYYSWIRSFVYWLIVSNMLMGQTIINHIYISIHLGYYTYLNNIWSYPTLDGYWIFTYSMEKKHTVFLLINLHLLGFNWFRFLFEDLLSYFFLTFIYIHGFCFFFNFLIFLFLYLKIYHNFKSHKVLNLSYNGNLLI